MTLFCSDIDGTLLNPERTLSKRTIAAIQAVMAVGHQFVLSSSRMPSSMELLEELYGASGVPLIAYNGARVLDSSRQVVLDVPIGQEATQHIFDTCSALQLHGSFYCGDNWYAWGDDRWSEREANNTGVIPSLESAREYAESGRMATELPHKVMCMGDSGLIDKMEESIDGFKSLVSYRSKDTYLEIANADCSKGDGLRAVADELRVSLEDSYFFGDNYNDLSAFKTVGHAIAVANSKDSVLAAANVVTARHHDDGVAAFLESWLRSKE